MWPVASRCIPALDLRHVARVMTCKLSPQRPSPMNMTNPSRWLSGYRSPLQHFPLYFNLFLLAPNLSPSRLLSPAFLQLALPVPTATKHTHSLNHVRIFNARRHERVCSKIRYLAEECSFRTRYARTSRTSCAYIHDIHAYIVGFEPSSVSAMPCNHSMHKKQAPTRNMPHPHHPEQETFFVRFNVRAAGWSEAKEGIST